MGATKILAGIMTQSGEILASRRSPMDGETQETTLRSIEAAIEDLMKDWEGPSLRAIGVGLFGQIDPETGIWLEAMNLPIKCPVALGKRLRDQHGVPAALDNDVHAATLAEMRWGIGKEASNFIYLNVGTGISAGPVSNGELLRGAENYAGELGHMVVRPNGPFWPCGRRGWARPA